MTSAARLEPALLRYGGPSMRPLFRGGDLLELEPCGPLGARAGDVIAFSDQDGGPVVVHRVVAVADAGLVTRGDNNDRLDNLPVKASQVLGRVTAIHRGARRITVAGGRRGLFLARLLRSQRSCRRLAAPALRGPYRIVRGFFERISSAFAPRARAVTFACSGYSVTRLIVPGRGRGVR